MPEDTNPADALASIRASQRVVHERVNAHGWRYDLIYSVVVAGMVGTQVLDIPFNVVGMTLGVSALAVMFQAETRRLGVLVTGVSPQKARWVAIAMGLLMAAAMIGVVALKYLTSIPIVEIAVGAVATGFVVALIGSRVWRRVYRAETGAGE